MEESEHEVYWRSASYWLNEADDAITELRDPDSNPNADEIKAMYGKAIKNLHIALNSLCKSVDSYANSSLRTELQGMFDKAHQLRYMTQDDQL